MEDAAVDEGIPLEWLSECAEHFARLIVELEHALQSATGTGSSHVDFVNPSDFTLNEMGSVEGLEKSLIQRSSERHLIQPDDELDILVKEFCQKKPDAGVHYLTGFLRSHGLRLQRWRIIASLARINKLGCLLRRRHHAKISRRPYKVI
ncbi:hypothetical protein BT96DRAFT_1005346 [Gymnopus androsaceus JB14]|uniref:Uncharacterized protein n=1 Tax=Gymnopus androsaceus JB14 TaxID=1447944 RepID=A0A6A4GPD9_9AGAR|nr:hypothetical protein BT96DRAFT_1005346 [Gymnopus androsaceus JB14]